MEARRPIQSLWETAPDTVPAKTDDLGAIMVSAKAFQVQMAQCKAYEKTVTAQRLNRAGASKIQYAVGDRVKFYLPPSQAQAQKAGRNPKHLLHWAGPGLLPDGKLVASASKDNTVWIWSDTN